MKNLTINLYKLELALNMLNQHKNTWLQGQPSPNLYDISRDLIIKLKSSTSLALGNDVTDETTLVNLCLKGKNKANALFSQYKQTHTIPNSIYLNGIRMIINEFEGAANLTDPSNKLALEVLRFIAEQLSNLRHSGFEVDIRKLDDVYTSAYAVSAKYDVHEIVMAFGDPDQQHLIEWANDFINARLNKGEFLHEPSLVEFVTNKKWDGVWAFVSGGFDDETLKSHTDNPCGCEYNSHILTIYKTVYKNGYKIFHWSSDEGDKAFCHI
jgi:hypothetical protein